MMLEKLRNKIDKLDVQILQLLAKRFEISRKISEEKKRNKLPIEDKERERQLFAELDPKVTKLNLRKRFVKKLFQLITSESKRIQNKL